MIKYPLNNYKVAIDKSTIDIIQKCNWTTIINKEGQIYFFNGKNYLHRIIAKVSDKCLVDHKNGDTLDLRKENLRAANSTQNSQNAKKRSTETSCIYKGVSKCARLSKYKTTIRIPGKGLHLGYFEHAIDAAITYDNAARKYHGAFACVNFPLDKFERKAIL